MYDGGGRGEKGENENRLTDIVDTGLIRHVFSNAIPDFDLDRIPLDTSGSRAAVFLVNRRLSEQSRP